MSSLKKYFCIFFINLIIAMIITYVIYKILFFWLDVYTKHNVYIKIPNLYSLTLNQAKKNLTKLGLHYEIDTSHYNPKYVPYHICNFSPHAGGIVKPGRVIFIQANANTFTFTKLPNIIFKPKYFALSRLYAKHFLVKNILFASNKNKGFILKVIHNKKYIDPGDIIPYRSELDLIIGKGMKKNIVFPNVVGMNLTSAKKILERNKIIIENIFYNKKNSAKNIVNQNIYRQSPQSGSIMTNKEQYINLWINNNKKDYSDNMQNNEEVKKSKESDDFDYHKDDNKTNYHEDIKQMKIE